MDITKLSRETPVTVEHIHRIILEEYYIKEDNGRQKQYEINSKTINRYIAEQTNLEQLKTRLLQLNNPELREYIVDRFNNRLNDLKALHDHADPNEEAAKMIAVTAAGAGTGLVAGGVVLSRSALAQVLPLLYLPVQRSHTGLI